MAEIGRWRSRHEVYLHHWATREKPGSGRYLMAQSYGVVRPWHREVQMEDLANNARWSCRGTVRSVVIGNGDLPDGGFH